LLPSFPSVQSLSTYDLAINDFASLGSPLFSPVESVSIRVNARPRFGSVVSQSPQLSLRHHPAFRRHQVTQTIGHVANHFVRSPYDFAINDFAFSVRSLRSLAAESVRFMGRSPVAA
jgi:hypothetical protein